jgi:hypothetical protein
LVQCAEHRGVGADPQPEQGDDAQSEAGGLAQEANGKAEVGSMAEHGGP